jgi:hypothetical protein
MPLEVNVQSCFPDLEGAEEECWRLEGESAVAPWRKGWRLSLLGKRGKMSLEEVRGHDGDGAS